MPLFHQTYSMLAIYIQCVSTAVKAITSCSSVLSECHMRQLLTHILTPSEHSGCKTAAAKQQLFPYDMSFLRPTTSQCSNHTSCTAVTRFHKASNPQTSAALRAKLKLRNMLLGVVMFELISTHMLRQVGEQNKRFVFSFFTVVVLVIWYNLRFYSLF